MPLPGWKYIQSFYTDLSKRMVVFFSDLCCTAIAAITAMFIPAALNLIPWPSTFQCSLYLATTLTVQAAASWYFGLYRGVWRFASIPDLIRIIKAAACGTCMLMAIYFFSPPHLDLIISFFTATVFYFLVVTLLSGTRLSYRWLKDKPRKYNDCKRVLIIGAGMAGESIVRELVRNANRNYSAIGLLDDDHKKHGLEIHGVRVLGPITKLAQHVAEKLIDLVIIAIPTLTTAQMRQVVALCESVNITYRTLPHFNDIASGRASLSHVRQVSVEDLLSRAPVKFDNNLLVDELNAKTVLITGAGGSIGSELCRKLAALNPAALILIEHSEFNLFQILGELNTRFPQLTIHHYLISITHQDMVAKIFTRHRPHYVFHAAAYKHVPLLESLARTAIENNIFGTQIIANAAILHEVERFILVSTDKAVHPNNVMGATKRCAELLCQCLNTQSSTRFMTVRFGNVLGSTGSVVPLFKEQIANGGPITITHPEMVRYFMTIEEAAQLIIQTITFEDPSDLYVLEMGEPVNILDLAEQMIKLSGRKPHEEIAIAYCGLRPGEKLNEELFYHDEKMLRTKHEKILQIDAPPVNATIYFTALLKLKYAFVMDDAELKDTLFSLANSKVEKQPTLAEANAG